MKKFNINKLFPILLVALTFNLSSCLKPKETYVDFSKVGTTIELPLAALNQETGVKVVTKTYASSATPSDLPVVVNIASPKTLDRDLTVTLAVNANDAIGKLNAAVPTGAYVLIPSNGYSVSSLKVTIPAGQRTGTVNFKINSSLIGTTNTKYVLPVSIVDGGGEQISLYSTVNYNIIVN
ncbi:DUF1735 domain-containing protein [Pedobacter jejuensis]|uniref:DUF1735 domain-containing protein n=1 Tax=Pedobacter jejuensis TaxID=1268550 RepID=A0A3N0BNT1_9SPHI|nr:DUF1735 domain-containing protein [Pedobacter jejuensis]RNL50547.1 DUF1735 domain-containing protein [Pedobacter jejuensis]